MSKSPIEDLREEKEKVESEIEKMLNELTKKSERVKDELGFSASVITAGLDSKRHPPADWSVVIDIQFMMLSDNS